MDRRKGELVTGRELAVELTGAMWTYEEVYERSFGEVPSECMRLRFSVVLLVAAEHWHGEVVRDLFWNDSAREFIVVL